MHHFYPPSYTRGTVESPQKTYLHALLASSLTAGFHSHSTTQVQFQYPFYREFPATWESGAAHLVDGVLVFY